MLWIKSGTFIRVITIENLIDLEINLFWRIGYIEYTAAIFTTQLLYLLPDLYRKQ